MVTVLYNHLVMTPVEYFFPMTQDNDYNDPASYVFIVMLCVSLVLCISSIFISFEIYFQTLRVSALS